MPEDEMDDALVQALSEVYGVPRGDAEAARQALSLPVEEFTVRFTEVVRFASDFGLDVRQFAEYIAENTSGIRPWRDTSRS